MATWNPKDDAWFAGFAYAEVDIPTPYTADEALRLWGQ